jgi:hypothetical protein
LNELATIIGTRTLEEKMNKSNLVKDVNSDLLAKSHNILSKLKKYYFQLLNDNGGQL